MKIFFFLFYFLISITWIQSQPIDFFREEITFELDSIYFIVNADFYFRNTTDKVLTPMVTLPVARINYQKQIDTILVFLQENLVQPLPVQVKDTLARFSIELPPGQDKLIKVIYQQRHNGHTAKYILTTTWYWKKPLEVASYTLVCPAYVNMEKFSIPPDKISNFNRTTLFYWNRTNYMPETDLLLEFHLAVDP